MSAYELSQETKEEFEVVETDETSINKSISSSKKSDESIKEHKISSTLDETDLLSGITEHSLVTKSTSTVTKTSSHIEDQDDLLSFRFKPSSIKLHLLNEFSDAELVSIVNELKLEVRHLMIENYIFEKFLKTNESQLIEGMETALGNLKKISKGGQNLEGTRVFVDTLSSRTSLGTRTLSLVPERQRIPTIQKNDLVIKETEDIQLTYNKFYKKSYRIKNNLKANLEELYFRERETGEALEQFEESVVRLGVDSLTQRIPAEKFIRYVQEWLKMSLTIVQKLRLRISTLSAQIRKVLSLLSQKKELGESLHAVDFEKLEIENKHYVEEIESKTSLLLDLKKMNGKANLILTNQKKFLQKQMLDMKTLQRDIDDKKIKTHELDKEVEESQEQLAKAIEHYNQIKEMIEMYQVPDVMDYVKHKAKLYDFKKNMKIWARRNHLQDVALNSSIREMKNITGSRKVEDTWFMVNMAENSDSDSDIEVYDQYEQYNQYEE